MKIFKVILFMILLFFGAGCSGSNELRVNFTDTNFKEAVEENDLEKIQLFIDNGYLERKFESDSPLKIIINYGTSDSFDLLLKNKKLNKKGSYEAVLYYLIKMKKEKMAEVIVEYVEDPDFSLVEGSGVTLLHEAARHGMKQVSVHLVSKGALTDKLTVGSYIPLTLAIKNKHMKTARYLLSVTEFKNIGETAKEIVLRSAIENDRSFTLLSKILSKDGFASNINLNDILVGISLEENDERLKDYIAKLGKR